MTQKVNLVLGVILLGLVGCNVEQDPAANSGCVYESAQTGGIANIAQLNNSHEIAQPFIANSAQSVTGLSLELLTVSQNNSHLQGMLTASIESDLSVQSSRPTNPSGSVLAHGTQDISQVSYVQPGLYNIALSNAVSLNAGQAYWVIVQVSYPPGSNYIEWLGSANGLQASQINMSGAPAPLGMNMNMKVGCP